MFCNNKCWFCLVHRKLTADVTEKIAEVEEKVSKVASESNTTDTQLSTLEADAKSLDNVVKELAEQLEFIKISDVRGQCLYACVLGISLIRGEESNQN